MSRIFKALYLSEVTSELKICQLAFQLQNLENQLSFKWRHIMAIWQHILLYICTDP